MTIPMVITIVLFVIIAAVALNNIFAIAIIIWLGGTLWACAMGKGK